MREAAPLSALRQRFGRLNRLGARSSSPAVIMARSDHIDKTYEDPIYGKAIRATWQWLSKTKNLDFGINHLDSKLKKVKPEDLAEMETRPPDAPLMFPAHLDAWVQTDPQPEPDPDVALFCMGVPLVPPTCMSFGAQTCDPTIATSGEISSS